MYAPSSFTNRFSVARCCPAQAVHDCPTHTGLRNGFDDDSIQSGGVQPPEHGKQMRRRIEQIPVL